MSTTVKFANGAELTLASMPTISGGIASFQIVPSESVTAESVLNTVKDYSNTQSFVISTNDTSSDAQLNYTLDGKVAIDSSKGNIIVSLRQKSSLEVQVAELGAQLVQAQLQIAALKEGKSS